MITIPTPFITCENWLMVNDAWIDVPNIIIVLSILSFYVLPLTVQQRNSRQKSCFLSVCPINYFISMHQNWMLHNTYHFLVANFAIFEFKLTFLGWLRFDNDFGCLDIINGLCQKTISQEGKSAFYPLCNLFSWWNIENVLQILGDKWYTVTIINGSAKIAPLREQNSLHCR